MIFADFSFTSRPRRESRCLQQLRNRSHAFPFINPTPPIAVLKEVTLISLAINPRERVSRRRISGLCESEESKEENERRAFLEQVFQVNFTKP